MSDDITQRLAALEARVAALEQGQGKRECLTCRYYRVDDDWCKRKCSTTHAGYCCTGWAPHGEEPA
jgi:hypothetical protein